MTGRHDVRTSLWRNKMLWPSNEVVFVVSFCLRVCVCLLLFAKGCLVA